MVIPVHKKTICSFGGDMRRISRKWKFLVVALVVIGLTITACGFEQKPETLNLTFQPGLVETMASNTPKGSGLHLVDRDKVVDLMKQVDLFLQAKTPYTIGDVERNMFTPKGAEGQFELGIIGASKENGFVFIQGVFIGCVDFSNGIIMLMGFQDQLGNRFVSPIKIYDERFKISNENGGFAYFYQTIDKQFNFANAGTIIKLNDKDKVINLLNEKVGMTLVFQVNVLDEPPLTDSMRQLMSDNGFRHPDEFWKQSMDLFSNVKRLNRNLVVNVWYPSSSNLGDVTISDTIIFFGVPSSDPVRIVTLEDLEKSLITDWHPMATWTYGAK